MKLFNAVCDNIKHTLSKIKNYSKVTLMSDPKASYFTIVDAVLSGPKEISPDALMSILGVSLLYLGCIVLVVLLIITLHHYRSVTTLSQE